jgi:hypothetical protein
VPEFLCPVVDSITEEKQKNLLQKQQNKCIDKKEEKSKGNDQRNIREESVWKK